MCTCSWLALALSSRYDPRDIPAPQKHGVTIGMSMTERQGGSDVRANTTVATPCDANDTVRGRRERPSFMLLLYAVGALTTVRLAPCPALAQAPGAGFFLHGHKWFTSAPMCDAFLTLAQTARGLSCFLVPRWVPHTGERNRGLCFLRLKVRCQTVGARGHIFVS